MAVYFITGKLGSGKTLQAVGLMRKYMEEGRPVCTNIDLSLKYLIGAKANKCKAFRIPDRPTSADLLAVGSGNPTPDESRNGGMFLDECGIWFNSRNWNQAGRQDVINFMLMVRKMGWDVYFLVQNISVIDKQARDTLAEYVVYCTAMNKVKIPFISAFYRMFTGSALPMPKAHHATVRYGTSYNGLKADSWFYLGIDLYSAYNTRQIFLTENSDDPEHSQGVHCLLPPSYYYKKPVYNRKNVMRLTKIYLKKYNRVGLVLGSLVVGVFAQTFLDITDPERFRLADTKPATLLEQYKSFSISSYTSIPNNPQLYSISNGEITYTSDQLIKKGIQVYSINACALRLKQADKTLDLKCGS